MSPEKLTECMVGTRQALGYDGLCAGAYGGIAAMMGGHLPNSEGKIVGDGDDVIPVSYTHLDVYKRQGGDRSSNRRGTSCL